MTNAPALRPRGRPRIPEAVRAEVLRMRAGGASYGEISRALTARGTWIARSTVVKIVHDAARGNAPPAVVKNSPDPDARGGGRP